MVSSSALASSSPVAEDDAAPATVSHPVVEPTAPSAGKALNAALGQLAKDPRNIDALIAAGDAGIALGDNEAALGFYTRADQLVPASNPAVSGKIKAAIAGARLLLDDPVEALRWYAQAESAGADPVGFAPDRGLAFDLVGDNVAAVTQYRKVLDHPVDPALRDEVTRRLALSLAIAGDRSSAERALLPLLKRQDRAAWRTHTFVLAIAGRSDEAVNVAHATMPPDLADAIAPYLRFMVRLTPAQQATVASLGKFPRAAEIGRDGPQIMAYAAAHPRAAIAQPPVAAPVLAQASGSAAGEAKPARRRHNGNPAAVMTTAAAVPEPEIVLPPPPPPPVAMLAAAPPPVVAAPTSPSPAPARTSFDLAQVTGSAVATAPTAALPPVATATPAISTPAPVVPKPTVLSRLDLPPVPRRTPAPAQAGPAAIAATPAVAAVTTPDHGSAQSIAPIPDKIPTKPAAAKTANAKPAVDKPAVDKAVKDKAVKEKTVPDQAEGDKPQKGKATRTRDAKAKHDETPAEPTDAKSAKSKAAHGKAAKDEAAETVLPPCKPATPAKGRKGKAAKAAPAPAAKGKSRSGKKGKADNTSETCAPQTHGDRPNGPGDVSRDSDNADTGKAKGKAKGHDKTADAEKSTDKASAKGGRHARYASRIWVEVLTGGDRDKMPGEWRNLVRKAHVLKKRKPYLTPWRSNFRLLTGPFDSDAEAQDFIVELRKDGVSGFEWTSPAGQAVDTLALP